MQRIGAPLIVAAVLLAAPPPAHANILRGLVEIVAGVLEVPRATLAGTFAGPPIIGTVAGVLTGTVRGVGLLAAGAFDIVGSAASLALKAAPFLPVFF